jgi:hypothetical protein
MLRERIRILRNHRDEDSGRELMWAIAALQKILGQELEEALDASDKALAYTGR